MGRLVEVSTGRQCDLLARHLIGRARHCDLQIEDRRASGEHAVLIWNEGWWLRDLGSTNGTKVEGQSLKAGDRLHLAVGNLISFGEHSNHWALNDISPPQPSARSESGEVVVAPEEILALPSKESPTISIFRDAGGWIAESPSGVTHVHDGQVLEVAATTWTLNLPEKFVSTIQNGVGSIGDISLQFAVSTDEEYVSANVVTQSTSLSLGARTHHYTMLTLARIRLKDARQDIPIDSRGWVYQEELLKQLKIDPNLLNIHIYRARQQLLDLGIKNAGQLIERRPSTRQLRIGLDEVEIQSL